MSLALRSGLAGAFSALCLSGLACAPPPPPEAVPNFTKPLQWQPAATLRELERAAGERGATFAAREVTSDYARAHYPETRDQSSNPHLPSQTRFAEILISKGDNTRTMLVAFIEQRSGAANMFLFAQGVHPSFLGGYQAGGRPSDAEAPAYYGNKFKGYLSSVGF